MSLTFMSIGEKRNIIDFRGKSNIKRHLQDIGFVKGEEVRVVGENSSGLIVLIKGVKIALNRGLASFVIVG